MLNRKSSKFARLTVDLFFTFGLLLGAGQGKSHAQTIEQIVDQFFPESLIRESLDDSEEGGGPAFKAFDFVVADLAATGKADFVVAVYTNGVSAAVRVLQRQGNAFVLVAEPNLPSLTGGFPKVKLLDLDGDRRSEIIASFSDARGNTADWIFKWSGTSLDLISPAPIDENGNFSVTLVNSDFFDLDRDGKLEVISARQKNGEQAFDVFAFDGIRYSIQKSLNFFGTFFFQAGAPVVTRETFITAKTDIPYLLKIFNGDERGRSRVSSAVISLNGVVVAGPERFNQTVGEITVPVTVGKFNELGVEITGIPGGQITILIEPNA